MTVTGDRTSWTIPPGRAVLIPAGIPHAIRMWGEVAMRYFAGLPKQCGRGTRAGV